MEIKKGDWQFEPYIESGTGKVLLDVQYDWHSIDLTFDEVKTLYEDMKELKSMVDGTYKPKLTKPNK